MSDKIVARTLGGCRHPTIWRMKTGSPERASTGFFGTCEKLARSGSMHSPDLKNRVGRGQERGFRLFQLFGRNGMLRPFALFFAVELAQLFGKVTLSVAMQHRLVLVDTIFFRDSLLVELPAEHDHRLVTELKKHQQDQAYMCKLLQIEKLAKSK